MILHIGAKEMVFHKEIVAIIRYDALTGCKSGRAYLQSLRDSGRLKDTSGGRPSSLVVLADRCCLSAISAQTLLRRLEEGTDEPL